LVASLVIAQIFSLADAFFGRVATWWL